MKVQVTLRDGSVVTVRDVKEDQLNPDVLRIGPFVSIGDCVFSGDMVVSVVPCPDDAPFGRDMKTGEPYKSDSMQGAGHRYSEDDLKEQGA